MKRCPHCGGNVPTACNQCPTCKKDTRVSHVVPVINTPATSEEESFESKIVFNNEQNQVSPKTYQPPQREYVHYETPSVFKRIVLPTLIALIAVIVYFATVVIVPAIVVIIVATVPFIGTILNLLMKLVFLSVSAIDLFYASVAMMITVLFIYLCTKYDKYSSCNAMSTACGIAGTLIFLIFAGVTVVVVADGEPLLKSIAAAFPYFFSAIILATNAQN